MVRVECMGVLCFTHRIQWYNCCGDSRDARWLVKDCIVSCYNHLVQSDYNRSDQFQNGCLSLRDGGSDEHDKGNSNWKSVNDAT